MLANGTRLGSFEILAPIGAGGMGEVYRARDEKLGRLVAIKVLPDVFAQHPDRRARFEREAKLLASLNEAQLRDFGGTRRQRLQTFEGVDESRNLESGLSCHLMVHLAQGQTQLIASAFVPPPGAMMIHQHPQHDSGGDGEEMPTAVVSVPLLDELQIGFAHELRGLERNVTVRPLPSSSDLVPGDAAEVLINEGDHLVECPGSAFVSLGE